MPAVLNYSNILINQILIDFLIGDRTCNMRSFRVRLTLLLAVILLQSTVHREDKSSVLRGRLEALGGALGLGFFVLPNPEELERIPQDNRNPLSREKVALGQQLFYETALGSKPLVKTGGLKNTYSCASCHVPKAGFQFGGRQAIGDGGSGFGAKGEERIKHENYRARELDVQARKSPSLLNAAYQKVMFWDGQFGALGNNVGTEREWREGTPMEVNLLGYEGLESQAIAGFNVHRLSLEDSFLLANKEYSVLFDKAFPDVEKSRRYNDTTAALAIAAYERTLISDEAPFQRWLKDEEEVMTTPEIEGALLFFGKAGCVNCHTGPALSSDAFHAMGMGELKGEGTYKTRGIKSERLGRGGFTKKEADMYKFKAPQLYNLADASHFGHGATFDSIREVVAYINKAIPQSKEIYSKQLSPLFTPLSLSKKEIGLITLFIEKSLHDRTLNRHVPQRLFSGNPFPVADKKSLSSNGVTGFR